LGIKPHLINKRAKGILECHLNGFRYTAQKGEVVDVIFSNIKSAFIQPPEESIAAIHFRLHHPIMIGKKKTEDVQFYAEVGGVAEDVEKYRRGEDDSDDEEVIRAARRKLEKELTEFAKACE
jgi:nucleosome binding factor SPN SPT16 subunit